MNDESKTKNKNGSFKKEQYTQWGKLGGRPKKETRLTEKITIRFTPEEFQQLQTKSHEKGFKFMTEYSRIILLEKEIPKFEQNKQLLKYAQNFTLISNYMKMGIFNTEEKNRLLVEIETLVQELRETVKWL